MALVGEEWVYQHRDSEPVQRVKILRQLRGGQFARFEVAFADAERLGEAFETPARRLRVPWDQRVAYERDIERTAHVTAFDPTPAESAAIEDVFSLLIPPDVADPAFGASIGATSIYELLEIEKLTGLSKSQLVDDIDWFEEDGGIVVSAEGGIRIAAAVCRRYPDTILRWVDCRENSRRDECLRRAQPGSELDVSPETAWWYYREYDRHAFELLRQWCGHRAVTAYERLEAAEAEAHRLDKLLDRALQELKTAEPAVAAHIAQARTNDRITPGNYRAAIEKPLKPFELPPRVEYRPRRWSR